MMVDKATVVLKLSFVAETVKPKKPTYISHDDDVMCFLEMNKNHFHVLHVEVDKDVERDQRRENTQENQENQGCDKLLREDMGS